VVKVSRSLASKIQSGIEVTKRRRIRGHTLSFVNEEPAAETQARPARDYRQGLREPPRGLECCLEMIRKISIGIIGFGRMGRGFVSVLQQDDRWRLARENAAADEDGGKLQ
jgi:hypothetical protein